MVSEADVVDEADEDAAGVEAVVLAEDSDLESLLLSDLVSLVEAVEVDDVEVLASDDLPSFLPLSRKSVTYQPPPFNWNGGADNCLE